MAKAYRPPVVVGKIDCSDCGSEQYLKKDKGNRHFMSCTNCGVMISWQSLKAREYILSKVKKTQANDVQDDAVVVEQEKQSVQSTEVVEQKAVDDVKPAPKKEPSFMEIIGGAK